MKPVERKRRALPPLVLSLAGQLVHISLDTCKKSRRRGLHCLCFYSAAASADKWNTEDDLKQGGDKPENPVFLFFSFSLLFLEIFTLKQVPLVLSDLNICLRPGWCVRRRGLSSPACGAGGVGCVSLFICSAATPTWSGSAQQRVWRSVSCSPCPLPLLEHQKEEDPRRVFEEPTDTPLWVVNWQMLKPHNSI